MNRARREFISTVIGAVGAVGIIVAAPGPAWACLYGKWKVRCPDGHIDIVEDVTCNHTCDKWTCRKKAFVNGEGDVVCPNGHVNHVKTGNRDERDKWIDSLVCREPGCGQNCNMQKNRK